MLGCHGGDRGCVGRTGLGGAVQAPCGAAAHPAVCPQRGSLLLELGFQLGAEAVSFSVGVTGMTGGRVEADEPRVTALRRHGLLSRHMGWWSHSSEHTQTTDCIQG